MSKINILYSHNYIEKYIYLNFSFLLHVLVHIRCQKFALSTETIPVPQ